jgi:hypothetical protein
MMIKRILGVIIILTAVLGLVACVGLIVVGPQTFDRVATDVDASLSAASSTLDTVSETLRLAQVTSAQMSTGLKTAELSIYSTAKTISETRPLITSTGQLLTGDLANSIDSVQATIPTLSKLADQIDKTLAVLSQAQILGFGLGIEYNPDEPMGQSIDAIGKSFDGIPARLRGMTGSISTANVNLSTMSTNLVAIGVDLREINTSLAKYPDLFGKYLESAASARQRLQALQVELRNDLQLVKTGLIVFLVWLGLAQLAPLYIGFELLFKPGSRKANE